MSATIEFDASVVAVVYVTDFKKAVSWYGNVLGFQPDYLMEEMQWGELKTNVPGLTLGIQVTDTPGGEGGQRLTFGVKDIEAARATVLAGGGTLDGDVMEIPGMVKLADWRDPDGNRFMFAQSLQ